MAVTYSTEIDLGTSAPAFDLPISNPWIDDREKETRALDDYSGADALVVVFMCNHCPYVKHVRPELIRVARDYAGRGVQMVGINSNDPEAYPDDSFERMTEVAKEYDYPFPYLFDESQEVAQRYGAVCTPDVYVFDGNQRLVYHGRVDATRPGQGTPDGRDLREALDALLEMGEVLEEQEPSMGCNIKWK